MDNKSLESTLASITSSKSMVNSGTTSDGPTEGPSCRREITYFSLIKGSWIDFDMDNKSLESTLLLLLVLHVDDGGAAAAAGPLALPGRAGLVPLAGPGFL